MRIILALILIIPLFFSAYAAKVAIIIDDIGYRKTDQNALTLPGNISFAFLPHTPFAKTLARQVNQNNKDVILHIPMESMSGKLLGPGAITSEMTEARINQQLSQALAEIPFAVGINNHMGSHLTKLKRPMASTMKFLKEHEMFFIDSMTTPKSKTRALAHIYGVPHLQRHVFLDNHTNAKYIEQQFSELISKAKRDDFAIGIAHPHPETIKALKQLLPQLHQHNIELVPVSSLFNETGVSASTQLISD